MKYYSDVTKKLYNTEDELKAAEKVVAAELAKKELATKEKKADAKVVEDAFKARNAARRDYNTKVVEARKAYNIALVEAKKAFDAAVTEATTAKDKAEEAYNVALKEFTNKHESYHMTLKDGDNVMTISNASDKTYENISREYNNLMDTILNIWNL